MLSPEPLVSDVEAALPELPVDLYSAGSPDGARCGSLLRGSVQAGLYPAWMPLVHTCRERGCNTLTMGELCLEHERLAEARLFARIGTGFGRLRTPAIALALAAFAAYIGRASGHVGR